MTLLRSRLLATWRLNLIEVMSKAVELGGESGIHFKSWGHAVLAGESFAELGMSLRTAPFNGREQRPGCSVT
jgi:hypothetical protein